MDQKKAADQPEQDAASAHAQKQNYEIQKTKGISNRTRKSLKCDLCNKRIPTKERLRRHLEKQHGHHRSDDTSFLCNYCDSDFYTSLGALENHVELVHKEFKCVYCNNIVHGKQNLGKHRSKCSNDTNRSGNDGKMDEMKNSVNSAKMETDSDFGIKLEPDSDPNNFLSLGTSNFPEPGGIDGGNGDVSRILGEVEMGADSDNLMLFMNTGNTNEGQTPSGNEDGFILVEVEPEIKSEEEGEEEEEEKEAEVEEEGEEEEDEKGEDEEEEEEETNESDESSDNDWEEDRGKKRRSNKTKRPVGKAKPKKNKKKLDSTKPARRRKTKLGERLKRWQNPDFFKVRNS